MKNSTLGTINAVALAALLSATGLAAAQEQRQTDQANRAEAMFARFDTDGDGQISLEEFETARSDRFANADRDGDGSINREELVTALSEKSAQRAERIADRMMSRHDTNGDGLISAEEIPADRAAKVFAKLDADGDGSIVLAEISEMRRGHGKRRSE